MIESIALENFYCFNERTEVSFVAGRERSRTMDEMYAGYAEVRGSVGQELSCTLGTQYIDLWSSSSLQGIAQTSLDSAPASFVTSLKQIA